MKTTAPNNFPFFIDKESGSGFFEALSMPKPVNHPAFPVAPYPGDATNPPIRSNSGMSVRDYFAAAALNCVNIDQDFDAVAEDAYALADAMLKERDAR